MHQQYPFPQPPAFRPVSPDLYNSPFSAAHWMLPTGRSWQSIAAGYVALVAVFVWPLGAVALVLGIRALVRASTDGSHGRGRAIFAVAVGLLTTALSAAAVVML